MSNRLCLKVMKRTISESTFSGVPLCNSVKDFLEAIGQQFKESDKIEITKLVEQLL